MAVLEQGVWHPKKEASELDYEDTFTMPSEVEAHRYHLYMSYACPFAHRPYLVIEYLELNEAITVSSVAAERYDNGWLFDENHKDPLFEAESLIDLYLRAKPNYSGRVSVPVMWDKINKNIISNDSSTLAMVLATKWLPRAKHKIELVPDALKNEIEILNVWLHQNVNRKVYHVGFATKQSEYDQASIQLFDALALLDIRLSESHYLHGDNVTLSDFFLLPTLVRFEAVYAVHFKANKQSIKEYEHLYRYMLTLLSNPRIRKTIDVDYMKRHYYVSHSHINPYRIVPTGPDISW